MSTSRTSLSLIYRIILLSWRNVLCNFRHSIATILAFAIGFTSVSIFDGFIADLHVRNEDGYIHRGMLGNVVIEKHLAGLNAKEDQWKYSLNKEDQIFIEEYLSRDQDVKERMRLLNISGMASAGDQSGPFLGMAFDLKQGAIIRGPTWEWNTIAGIPLHLSPMKSLNTGTLMGKVLGCESTYQGKDFYLPSGNYTPENRPFKCMQQKVFLTVTTEASQVNVIDMPVSGIYDGGFREVDKRSLIISLEDAQRLMDTDKISLYAVLLNAKSQTDQFVTRMRAAVKEAGKSIDIIPWIEHQSVQFTAGGFKILEVFRNLFMFVIVAIGAMSVVNTMMKSVNERVREIGTLRSFGFLRWHLMLMFSLEGLFLSVISCGIGLILTFSIIFAVELAGIKFKAGIMAVPINLNILKVPNAWFMSGVLLSTLATGAALFAARRAIKMGIADALRHS